MTNRSLAHFSGERLHAGDSLFRVDLARHRAAYRFADHRLREGRSLDLGCGAGYGTVWLRERNHDIWGLDRHLPDSTYRASRRFICGRFEALPFAAGSFRSLLGLQVIEHIHPVEPFLEAIRCLLEPGGELLLTTPNASTSTGANPYHVHEFEAEELRSLLLRYFDDVELYGIQATALARRFYEARHRLVSRLLRVDPLRLRDRIPSALAHWLFARLAILVRLRLRGRGALPEVSWRDFPIGEIDADCLDLLAICRHTA